MLVVPRIIAGGVVFKSQTIFTALKLPDVVVCFAVGCMCVGKILRCFADVSLETAPLDDESISLTSDDGDVSVDDCCLASS